MEVLLFRVNLSKTFGLVLNAQSGCPHLQEANALKTDHPDSVWLAWNDASHARFAPPDYKKVAEAEKGYLVLDYSLSSTYVNGFLWYDNVSKNWSDKVYKMGEVFVCGTNIYIHKDSNNSVESTEGKTMLVLCPRPKSSHTLPKLEK